MAQLDRKKVALEQLVDELTKEQPRRQLIKHLTSELGIAYSVDPVTQMGTVLQSMNAVFLRPHRRKDLER